MEENKWKKSLMIKDTIYEDNLKSIELYHQYVAKMLPTFLNKLDTINTVIKRLQENGKISQYVILNARVKSQLSARTKTSQKAKINDVLGVEIITATEEEFKTISDYLEMFFTTIDKDEYDITTKNIRKKNRL